MTEMPPWEKRELLGMLRRSREQCLTFTGVIQATQHSLTGLAGSVEGLSHRLEDIKNRFTTLLSPSTDTADQEDLISTKTQYAGGTPTGQMRGQTTSGADPKSTGRRRAKGLKRSTRAVVTGARTRSPKKSRRRSSSAVVTDSVNPKIKYQVQRYKKGFMRKAIGIAVSPESTDPRMRLTLKDMKLK